MRETVTNEVILGSHKLIMGSHKLIPNEDDKTLVDHEPSSFVSINMTIIFLNNGIVV